MADDTPERRKSLLTDDDIEKIGGVFTKHQTQLFETIGYDVTTPESRSAIRDDHRFVRIARQVAVWGSGVAIVAIAGVAAAKWGG